MTQRADALVYLADDGRYVVVASKGGDARPPARLAAQPRRL